MVTGSHSTLIHFSSIHSLGALRRPHLKQQFTKCSASTPIYFSQHIRKGYHVGRAVLEEPSRHECPRHVSQMCGHAPVSPPFCTPPRGPCNGPSGQMTPTPQGCPSSWRAFALAPSRRPAQAPLQPHCISLAMSAAPCSGRRGTGALQDMQMLESQ